MCQETGELITLLATEDPPPSFLPYAQTFKEKHGLVLKSFI